jgi:hypothetical protein
VATLQTLLDDLNDRIGDANNAAGAGEAAKIRWLNAGINAMWPFFYEVISDATLVIVADQREYALPAGFSDRAKIFSVEIETDEGSDLYFPTDDFDYQIGISATETVGGVLNLRTVNGYNAGAKIRVKALQPLDTYAAAADTIVLPVRAYELPVLYALGIEASRKIPGRTRYQRFSTTAAQNGVDINEVMNSGQYWFAQFELMCERLAMPWPASIGGR